MKEEQIDRIVSILADKFTTGRQLELLSYASICFAHSTNPFETVHLQKKNVTLDECFWLSEQISKLLNEKIDYLACTGSLRGTVKMLGKQFRAKAEKDFEETQ
jgi:hypothetical protein